MIIKKQLILKNISIDDMLHIDKVLAECGYARLADYEYNLTVEHFIYERGILYLKIYNEDVLRNHIIKELLLGYLI